MTWNRPSKNKTLQAYLKRFGRDDLIDIIVVDHKRRLHYPVVTQHTVSDMGNPCIVVIVGSPEDLDRGNLEHTDLSDQMALDFSPNTDFVELAAAFFAEPGAGLDKADRKSTRLNSSH